MALRTMVVIGTRPEAIKLAPVVQELKRFPEQFEVQLVATGQHREMLDQVMEVFRLEPDHDLDIMIPRQSLSQITTRALMGMEEVLKAEQPDLVIVEGDTTTVFAVGLVGFYYRIPVAHVEAGLRTDDKYQPFPEEINRRLTGVLADLHFAPTPGAKQNLLNEGTDPNRIFVTGNTVIDALLWAAEQEATIALPGLEWLEGYQGRIMLVTAHRRENWGEPLEMACQGIAELLDKFPDLRAIYAVHRNPVVQEIAEAQLGKVERAYLIDPPDYLTFVNLMKQSTLILTDSGGVQEEAPSLGVPILILREVTERPEAVAAGAARLVGTDREAIVSAASELLSDEETYGKMAQAVNPYGDGRASSRIREALLFHFGMSKDRPEEFEGQ